MMYVYFRYVVSCTSPKPDGKEHVEAAYSYFQKNKYPPTVRYDEASLVCICKIWVVTVFALFLKQIKNENDYISACAQPTHLIVGTVKVIGNISYCTKNKGRRCFVGAA